MAEVSRRELILDEIKARLEVITAGDEFATDAGASVHIGELPVHGDDADPKEAIAVVIGDDESQFQGESFEIDLPLRIQALVSTSTLSLGESYRQAERIAADIKRAIQLTDRKLITADYPRGLLNWNGIVRGSTRVVQQAPNSRFVGVEIEYTCPYLENWTRP